MMKSLLFSLTLLFSLPAQAHKASDAYLRLELAPKTNLQLSVALRDLDRAIDTLDANNDRQLTAGEVTQAMPQILIWAQQGIAIRCAGDEKPLRLNFEALEQRSDGVFVRLRADTAAGCDLASTEMRYSLMQALDADHRAILSIPAGSKAEDAVRVLTPASSWLALQPPSASALQTLGSFISLGISHIGSGADHVAFIICLVLSLALHRKREWKTLLLTITAFTLGHSITLVAATLGWVGSPVWVEPVIGLSIAFAAALNLFKTPSASFNAPWLQSAWFSAGLAAVFGLVHGLGFSGAMTEAQIPQGALVWALAGFNIGVELGQLLIIGAWGVLYWAIHRWLGYQRFVVQGGSGLLVLLGLYWFVERLG